ncbi:MAG: SDR family oxidoreductase [Cyclobacteriaceae bacterium]
MKSLAGKSAIVTGAGTGIGFEVCKQLVINGCHVILNDLDKKVAEQAAGKLAGNPGKCVPVAGDSSDMQVIQSFVSEAVSEFGKLDIAIANAGITSFGDFLTFQLDRFQQLLDVNLKGTFFLAQHAANQMKKQGGGGSIVMTSSVTGHQAVKNLSAYGMSKAAIEMLAKALVIDLSPLKINVNCVAPGATVTERTLLEEEDYEGTWSKLIPMGRACYPIDMANAIMFLASEEARQITGQTIVVDGGWTATSPGPQ